MATLHGESGLPYAVWKRFRAQEIAEEKKAATSLKRKAPASSGPSRSIRLPQLLSTLSPDAKQLYEIVMKSEETPLRVELAKSILTATPSDLVAYKSFLGSLVPASQTPLHCVRCHESYVEYENNSRSCKIPHDNWEYLGDDLSEDYLCSGPESCDSEGELQPLVRCPCCGQRMREDQVDYNREMCIQEKHTTDPTKVDYFIDPDAGPKKKKKAEYSLDYYGRYKNKNPRVITCKEKKCSRA